MAKRGNKKEDNSNENKDPQNRTQIIITIVGAVATVIVALIGILPNVLQSKEVHPTPTVIPTNTIVVPTATVLTDTPIPPTETQLPTTPTPLGYYDNFSQDTNLLLIGTPVSDERGKDSKYIADGIYHWDVQTFDNHTFSASIDEDLKIPNFEYEVIFHQVEISNTEDGNYGIRFRQNSSFFYVFYISSNNESYGLDKYSYQEEKYYALVREILYPGINKNGNNTLKVVAQGESIHLYINGVLIERVLDKSSLAGKFSLYSWLPYPNDIMKMEINHLSIVPLNISSSLDAWPTQLTDVQAAEFQLSNVDDEMTIRVNGQEVITSKYGDVPTWIPFRDYLKNGNNSIEIRIRNGAKGQDCSGYLRLKLNGIVNSAYQWFWDKDEAPANTECFHETVTLPLK